MISTLTILFWSSLLYSFRLFNFSLSSCISSIFLKSDWFWYVAHKILVFVSFYQFANNFFKIFSTSRTIEKFFYTDVLLSSSSSISMIILPSYSRRLLWSSEIESGSIYFLINITALNISWTDFMWSFLKALLFSFNSSKFTLST